MNKPLIVGALAAIALLPACSPASSHSSYTAEEAERPKTAEELRAELLAREEQAPEEYLHTEGRYHRNLLDQLVLEGDIYNAATLANFKDPVLTVTWLSKTGTEMKTVQYQLYEYVRAHRTAHFKLKTAAPSDVESISMGVFEATVIE